MKGFTSLDGNRKVKEFDATINDNVYKPLYEYGCNKICRATHEDMMNKVQINQYISGLHKVGSEAIHRYTMLELGDIFALMCVAFAQPLYKVDKDLNIIEDSKKFRNFAVWKKNRHYYTIRNILVG
ncbi:MAG: hypothetical protein LIP09_16610 [Bacteroidales bacterium]|nr:hypothetical protein [Bacteroidales bacterium]